MIRYRMCLIVPAVLLALSVVFVPSTVFSAGMSEARAVAVLNVVTSDEFMGKLNEPYAVFYDAGKERLYVSDSVGKRLVSFDNKFQYLSELSDERIKLPLGLYKSDAGDFYVLDGGTNEIKIVNLQEKSVTPIKISGVTKGREEFVPGDFAVLPNGNIYIIDKLNARIVLVDGKGAFIREFAPPKSDKVRLLKDVKVDKSGNVYVVAPVDAALYVFTSKGDMTFRVFRGGKNGNDLVWPVSVAVDSLGFIHVLDKKAGRIAVYAKGGAEPVYFVSTFGHNEGQFFSPNYLFIAGDDRFFVVDGNRIQVFRVEKKK